MAGHRSTLRKTPPRRLKQYFTTRIEGFPSDFDWTSGGTTLADQLDAAISKAGSRLENELRIELETIHGVADRDGWRSVEEVCRGADIDLDRCEGQHDAIMMLALEHREIFERAVSASSFMRRNGGKDWSAFELTNVSPDSFIGDAAAKERFLREALAILEVPPGRKHEADWYEAVRRDPITEEESRVTQATVYVEERPESGLAFGENDSVEMTMVPRVGELGFSYDPKDGVVEICAAGKKAQRDRYAQAFAECFFEQSPLPVEVTRRPINFARLAKARSFEADPADRIERYEFSELAFYSEGGGFARANRSISSWTDALATVRRFPRRVGR